MNNQYKPPTITLTPDQKQTVDDTLRLLQDLGPEIEKAQSCGIECAGHEQLRNHLHELMTNVKRHFSGPSKDPTVY